MRSVWDTVISAIRMNKHFAQSMNDKLAFGIFVFGAHLALWYEFYIVYPHYHPEYHDVIYAHYAFTAVIYINWALNLFFLVTTKAHVDYIELQAKQKPDWRYCVTCQGYFPPRSHHCKICDVCILKRDHHCWFAGYCVGHSNHRYYLVMLLYVWIAAIYGNFYHLQFIGDTLGGYGFYTWFCVLFPHAASLFGFITLYEFFVCALSFTALLLLVMFSWMLQIQVAQIYHSQSKYERKEGILVYDQGWKQNIREVMGARWYVAWLSPFIHSPLPGDGISFQKNVKYK